MGKAEEILIVRLCCLQRSGSPGVMHQACCDFSLAAARVSINWIEFVQCGVVFEAIVPLPPRPADVFCEMQKCYSTL